ncbi:pilus assembly protein [Paraburkholderia sp. D15]|nr:hypothetical protein [Paraburkholderia sp. D15]WGS51732.1 pilus assembly protein [Paraburkholderia sp. D15]
MLATSAAWFESSLAAARGAGNVRDYLQAFHAADSALTSCARAVVATAAVEDADSHDGVIGAGSTPATPATPAEPTQWKLQTAFEAAAITPVSQWPGSLRPPQCLIEAWRLATRPDARAYLVTARGFGRNNDAQVWLQTELVFDNQKIERHWRRIVARPF